MLSKLSKLMLPNFLVAINYKSQSVIWIQEGGVTLDLIDTVSDGTHIINEWQENPLQADFDELEFDWCEEELIRENVYLLLVVR